MKKVGIICSGTIPIKIIQCAFLFLNLFFYYCCNAQKSCSYLDISKIQFSASLKDSHLFDSSDSSLLDNEISKFAFDKTYLSASANKNLFAKLSLCNGSESVQQIYFSPGLYFADLKIFKASANEPQNLSLIEKSRAGTHIHSGFILLTLNPKEKADFFLKIVQLKTGAKLISPQLVNKNFIDYYKSNLSNKHINLIAYLISGVLLMMTLYSLIIFLQHSKIELLYYAGYAFSIAVLAFSKAFLHNSISIANYFFEGYFDFMLKACGFLFYIAFVRNFLRTSEDHIMLEKNLKTCQSLTITLIIFFSMASFAMNDFFISDIIEHAAILLFFLQSIYFVIYGVSKNDPLMNYLVIGRILFILFSVLFFTTTSAGALAPQKSNSVFNEPSLYFETGVLLELILSITAIAYREKKATAFQIKESMRFKLEHERNEFEKKIAVIEAKSNERNRISADMHDELGSGVTAIKMMSEILKHKMKDNSLPEIEKICLAANELLDKMDNIIWTMNSSNDSAENLVVYIRIYTTAFLKSAAIDCNVTVPRSIPSIQINGDKRKNIFLAVKECLNNIIKHAHASRVDIRISIEKKLVIVIADDGIGINTEKLRRFGNGICNIKKRMANIDGSFEIKNQKGTTAILSLKL